MKKKMMRILIVAIVLCMTVVVFASCGTANQSSGGTKDLADVHIGYVQAGPEPYYQTSANGAIAAGEKVGIKMTVLNSESTPSKEMSNVQDLIAMKVDAIIVFTTNSDSAQEEAKLANEANIPFFVIGSAAAEGEGKVTATIKPDFLELSGLAGKYVAENYPDAKIGIIEGMLGQQIAEFFTQGFVDNLADTNEVVEQKSADWSRDNAMSITQDWITAGVPLDMIYVHNEDMAAGVVQALKEANKLNDIKVVSTNGSPEGLIMLEAGELLATANESPSMESAMGVKVALDAIFGKPVESEVKPPIKLLTKDNIDEVISWGPECVDLIDWGEYVQ